MYVTYYKNNYDIPLENANREDKKLSNLITVE